MVAQQLAGIVIFDS